MPLQTLPCRAFQRGFALGARLLPWRTPTVLSGAGSLLKLPDVFSREGASRPLVVASRRQCADERFLALRAALEGRGIRPSVFSGVEPDPSVATVEKLAAQYRADGCDSFLVLGGGSPIDAAKVTAQTGMDALTHAVEAYLSLYYNTRETRALAESAVRDIFRYLPVACRDGQSLTARERMLRASFGAGCAFTRASVGNVHAIAHTLGGLYGIPHGLACAVTLPVVLEDYGAAVHPHLARLGSLIGLTGTERERAVGFLAAICALNASLGIPDRFDGIRGEDLPRMAAWAAAEANPVYPVPVVYDQARFRRVLERLRA